MSHSIMFYIWRLPIDTLFVYDEIAMQNLHSKNSHKATHHQPIVLCNSIQM